jgi:hypothetical protein
MMMELSCEDFLVCYGGINEIYDPATKILQLRCNDFYEGLPEKVIKMFKFISQHDQLSKYKFYAKLDDDIQIKQLLKDKISADYMGRVYSPSDLNRCYHLGKCSPDSKWNTEMYYGEPAKSWCLGGNGYILSNKSIKIISQDESYFDEVYEDMYVSKLLNKFNINPTNLNDIQQYFVSPNH